jgi:hypothetical protein
MWDLHAIGELLDTDVKWHGGDVSAPGACHNREQALQFIRQARSRQRVGELIDVIDAGDKVVVIMRPPSGKGESAALSANCRAHGDNLTVDGSRTVARALCEENVKEERQPLPRAHVHRTLRRRRSPGSRRLS